MYYDFLFDCICILANLECGWHQLISIKLDSQSLAQFDRVRNVLRGPLLGGSRPKDKLSELVVI